MVLKADLNTHIYLELINAINREEDLLNEAIKAAEGEAISYLERFNTDVLFAKEGADRDSTLLMYLKDITVWHFIAVSNPDTDLNFRELRYTNAINWLSKIQAGKLTPKGWQLNTVESANDAFTVTSEPKRTTSF